MAWRESKLTQGMLDSCNTEFAEKAAFRMPDKALRKMLAETKLRAQIIRYYPEASGRGFDTYERDWLLDTFAMKVLGLEHWPCFSSPDEMGKTLIVKVTHMIDSGELLDA